MRPHFHSPFAGERIQLRIQADGFSITNSGWIAVGFVEYCASRFLKADQRLAKPASSAIARMFNLWSSSTVIGRLESVKTSAAKNWKHSSEFRISVTTRASC